MWQGLLAPQLLQYVSGQYANGQKTKCFVGILSFLILTFLLSFGIFSVSIFLVFYSNLHLGFKSGSNHPVTDKEKAFDAQL